LVKAFEEVNNIKIPYVISPRRLGDIAACYADVTKANTELQWKAKRDIKDMCRDAWKFESRQVTVNNCL
jgi:UDP-glucose 4-epimerase